MTNYEMLLSQGLDEKKNIIVASGNPGFGRVYSILHHVRDQGFSLRVFSAGFMDSSYDLRVENMQDQVLLFDCLDRANNSVLEAIGEIVTHRSFNGEPLMNLLSVVLVFSGDLTSAALAMASMAPSVVIAVPRVSQNSV